MKQEDRDFIDHLKDIHYKCRAFLSSKNYEELGKYLNTFTAESDINELKTILIITKSLENFPEVKDMRKRILDLYTNLIP